MSESQSGKHVGENNPMYGVRITGEDHWNYGKHLSNETRNKIRESLRGKRPSEETRKKLSEAHKKSKGIIRKSVICIDTGILYNTVTDASLQTKININSIIGCCKERRKTAGGYHWCYLYNQTRKDGTIIPGAITLGLITEEEALRMLEKQKDAEEL